MSLFGQSGLQLSHANKVSPATIEATFQAALDLLALDTWTDVKTQSEKPHYKVHIKKHKPREAERDKLTWFQRISEHPEERDLTYDEFREGLLLNHSVNEQKYVPDLKHVEQVKVLVDGEAEIWLMQYKTPMITSDRDFAELILVRDQAPDPQTGLRSFLVIQIPVLDVPPSKGHVRGRYTSVENVQELPGGKILWRMTTASSAGGALPQATTDMAMPGEIAHDVSNFINWAKKRKDGQ